MDWFKDSLPSLKTKKEQKHVSDVVEECQVWIGKFEAASQRRSGAKYDLI